MLLGLFIICYRVWKNIGFKLPFIISLTITIISLNTSLVFFRLEDLSQAFMLLKAMYGFNGFILPEQLSPYLNIFTSIGFLFEATPLQNKVQGLGLIVISFIIVLTFKNSVEKMDSFKPSLPNAIFIIIILIYSMLNLTNATEFLYFNF